jgi:hypothetical protein
MTKRFSFCVIILAGVLLFDFVSFWRAGESAPEFQLIQVDAVTGATGCTDVDGDDYCAELGFDCDDTNPEVYPDAPEVCDGIDNNCNEIIDGGCDGCTDSDNDSFAVEGDLCGEIDCNDSNETISPDAEEICDDGIDNNCDKYTDAADETCIIDDCTDEDHDMFCAEQDDCDDTDDTINPDAVEFCGDGVDNNCDGTIDEGCGICAAELALGDDLATIEVLRAFRDEKLKTTPGGRFIVELYYQYDPLIIALMKNIPTLRPIISQTILDLIPYINANLP